MKSWTSVSEIVKPAHFVEFLKETLSLPEFAEEKGFWTDEKFSWLVEDVRQENEMLHKMYLATWMESVQDGNEKPAYWIYGEPLYLSEVFVCWRKYSKKYCRFLKKLDDKVDLFSDLRQGGANSVVDLGCGMGFSTVALKKMFPSSKVYGTNLGGTFQYKVNKRIFDCEGIGLVDGNLNVPEGELGLVFASEFFEHLDKPLDFLLAFIAKHYPKWMVFANTFSVPDAIGHFRKYDIDGKMVEGKKVGRIFNKTLRSLGYEKVETGFFNGRPAVFKRKVGALKPLF